MKAQSPKTNWVGGNPFEVKPAGTGKRLTKERTDTALLQITNDPVPPHRVHTGNKYDALFTLLQPGQAIKCGSGQQETGRVANALRKWHQVRGNEVVIKSCAHYPSDGLGRVWLMELKGGKA
jgi:hypothetical protein